MYTRQITEIAEYVDNFFAFTQQEKFPDALTNGRKLAEAVCKLVIFEKHGEPKKVRTYRTPIDKRMLGDLIPEVKGLIDNTSVIDAIETLRDEGNPATHTGMRQFTSKEISKCEPHVRYLVRWLFTILLKKAIPPDIQDSLDNRPRILNIFQPLHSVLKLGDYQELFDNQLVFFTPEEEDMIEQMSQQMSQQLIHARDVLLLGDPATGKSITAIALAEKLKALGYHRYYHSLKIRTQKEVWDDIAPLVHCKVLFIIDDCHLDVDTFANIYRKFHQWENPIAECVNEN